MDTAATTRSPETGRAPRYAQVVRLSKKAEWQIDRDLIQGRTFDFSRKFLPDGLSRVDRLTFLSADEARLLVLEIPEAGEIESARPAVIERRRASDEVLHQPRCAGTHDVLAEVVPDVIARVADAVGVLARLGQE